MLAFPNRILFVGFGAVARCTLPILLKHIRADPKQITIDVANRSVGESPSVLAGASSRKAYAPAENGYWKSEDHLIAKTWICFSYFGSPLRSCPLLAAFVRGTAGWQGPR